MRKNCYEKRKTNSVNIFFIKRSTCEVLEVLHGLERIINEEL